MPQSQPSPDPATILSDRLSCSQCRCGWLVAGERWHIYLSDDGPSEAVTYCGACASRKFGKGRSSRAVSAVA